MTRERWAEEFGEVARRYWTDERTHQVTSGKKIPFLPGPSAVLLRALGLLHTDASMPPRQVRKYRQINHMLAALRPSLKELAAREPVIRLVDAACGRSYLTLLIAWWLRHEERHPVEILAIDRRPPLLDESRRRATLVGLDEVIRFAVADLHDLDLPALWARELGSADLPNAIVSLHGCDTATDRVLFLGIRHRLRLVAAVPCCQAELAAAWADTAGSPHPLAPLWALPSLRRDAAATLTDALRTTLLRAMGYQAAALEFVPTEHTEKNILLRATLRTEPDPDAWAEYLRLKEGAGGATLALERSLADAGLVPVRDAG